MTEDSVKYGMPQSDDHLAQSLGAFVKFHRLKQNKTQEWVSMEAGISRSTLSLLEREGAVTMQTFFQVLRVLDLLYVLDVFKVSNELSPVEYAKLKRKERKRAWSVNDGAEDEEDLQWEL